MAVKKSRRKERRENDRVDARLSMRVEGLAPGESGQIVTESQNVSASGVYCLSSHYLAPLSKVSLTLVLPKLPNGRAAKELIKCDGIVVRCDTARGRRADAGFELACMFNGLLPEHRERLEDFVTWRNLQALRAATRPKPAARPTTAKRTAGRAATNGAAPAARSSRRSGTSPRSAAATSARRTVAARRVVR